MTKHESPQFDAGGRAVKDYSAKIIETFSRYIKKAAEKDPHFMQNGNFESLMKRFVQSENPAFVNIYQDAWNDFGRTYYYLYADEEKYLVIERLLFLRLEPFLVESVKDVKQGKSLPKLIKSGLYAAIPTLFGRDNYERINISGRVMIDTFEEKYPDRIAWKYIIHQKDSIKILNEFLVKVAEFFLLTHKRRQWLQGLIDNDVSDSDKTEKGERWVFDMIDYGLMLKVLYTPLWKAMEDRIEYENIERTFQASDLQNVKELEKKVAQILDSLALNEKFEQI